MYQRLTRTNHGHELFYRIALVGRLGSRRRGQKCCIAASTSTATSLRAAPPRSRARAALPGPRDTVANLISRYRSATGGTAHEYLGSFRTSYWFGSRIARSLRRTATADWLAERDGANFGESRYVVDAAGSIERGLTIRYDAGRIKKLLISDGQARQDD
jgi:hypothetical protein